MVKTFQVWRFLITFADILGLWPFTLDEFVQAFHDYVGAYISFFLRHYFEVDLELGTDLFCCIDMRIQFSDLSGSKVVR